MVVDVLIAGGDGWWLECSKSITREDRERLPPPPEEEYSVLIVVYILNIVNASLSLSNVPRSLKVAIIRSLLKQVNLSLIFKNYRPVSNLKYISKIIERVLLEQLSEHLLTNNIYEPMQSAYRHSHSTETT